MPRQRRKPCKSGRTAYIASKSYCGNDEFGVQTDVSLSHTARDELWTASCSDPVADFKGECEGVVSEAPTNSLGVLDLDCVKVVLIVDDADNPDDANADDFEADDLNDPEADEDDADDLEDPADDEK